MKPPASESRGAPAACARPYAEVPDRFASLARRQYIRTSPKENRSISGEQSDSAANLSGFIRESAYFFSSVISGAVLR